MKNTILFPLAVFISLVWFSGAVAQESPAPTPTPPPTLNNVKIGRCLNRDKIKDLKDAEEKKGLVIDARPFTTNQSSGKVLFTSGNGRVSVVHMNPFIYNYRISVAQEELVSTALTDFLKLILPGDLGELVTKQSGRAGESVAATANKLTLLEARLKTLKDGCHPPSGAGGEVCEAMNEMLGVFKEIAEKLASGSTIVDRLDNSKIKNKDGGGAEPTNKRYLDYAKSLSELRNEELEAYDTCSQAQQLNGTLNRYDFQEYFDGLNTAETEISETVVLAKDLEQLATEYTNDEGLKDKIVRCKGFNCANQFLQYATTVQEILGTNGYQRKLEDLRGKGQQMQNIFELTQSMKTKEGLFARSFDIKGKFELSQATISVKREVFEVNKQAGETQSGKAGSGSSSSSNPLAGLPSQGTAGSQFGTFVPPKVQAGTPLEAQSGDKTGKEEQPSKGNALAGEVNEVVQLGRPKFMLSGGLVYSPLPRRTFEKVSGFVLDADGNPTGTGDASVIGFKQNSERRLFPMIFLNSRLLDYERGSVYFSFGVTGKKDDNIDLEYLVGPSVSFLNDRALFTFGAYGGMTQKLVNDVRVGQEIPDSLGEVKLYRKELTWKPGFSFSYNFSRAKKVDAQTGGGGGGKASTPEADLKNEIRIGSVPFNLALGMAVTSLEQRTYEPIAGFARDAQGNLTNGQTLARIVGLTSSSGYRLSPMAMLHSRLTNFGPYDFYFTTGITGKKTKDDFDVEYLLGGSVNVYRRKVFLTFGTFIGKQTILSPGFFEGQDLGKSQSIGTQDRYVWKPAFAFSYDISRIITRPN